MVRPLVGLDFIAELRLKQKKVSDLTSRKTLVAIREQLAQELRHRSNATSV